VLPASTIPMMRPTSKWSRERRPPQLACPWRVSLHCGNSSPSICPVVSQEQNSTFNFGQLCHSFKTQEFFAVRQGENVLSDRLEICRYASWHKDLMASMPTPDQYVPHALSVLCDLMSAVPISCSLPCRLRTSESLAVFVLHVAFPLSQTS
jgi:hypothetical protein